MQLATVECVMVGTPAKAIKRKPGRKPLPAAERAGYIGLRVPPPLLAAIDAARLERPLDPLDRSAMIRQLVAEALEARAKAKGRK